jgi:uncharacterized protein YecE (DUF72 family)
MDTAFRQVSFGVAGWSYPDWRDTVYRLPSVLGQPSLFAEFASDPVKPRYVSEPLVFLANYVDMVEVNSSFYRIPSPQSTATWAQNVQGHPGFFFTAKLHQDFTHGFRRDDSLARQFLDAFAPLREATLLQGFLAQFRYDFADEPGNRRLLEWLHERFGGAVPLIFEVRHRSWQEPEALQFLLGMRATVANLDYPTARDSFDLKTAPGGSSAYLRLHGRNRQAWFASNLPPHETYNYDYSNTEIEELAHQGEAILGTVKTLTIVANNHYQGKAVSAALRLKAAMTRQRVPVPPALLETYPELRAVAVPSAAGGA